MRLLLVTFSDNADHQDTVFGMYEQLIKCSDVYLLAIKKPKVPLQNSFRTWLVDCPENPGICKKTFNLSLLLNIVRRIRLNRFDAIYIESLHVWNIPIMLFCLRKTHIYQVIHEVIPHSGDRLEKMVDLTNRIVCRLADTIVLRNQTYIEEMIRRYKISSDRVKYLELWRRYPDFTEPVYSGRVLFFGRINPYKGAANLLEIARLCPEIQFDVIGRTDPKVENLTEKLSQTKNISMKNAYVSDEEMKNAFVNTDWVILPYTSASQSGVIIDAYRYSRPVIAFDVGAISEQVSEGYSGYLIQEGDIQGFVTVLKREMMIPKEELKVLCMTAHQYGAAKYSAAGAVNRFLNLISSEAMR